MNVVPASTRHIKKIGQRGKHKTIEQLRANIHTYESRRKKYKEMYRFILLTPVADRNVQDRDNLRTTLRHISIRLYSLNTSLSRQMKAYRKIDEFNKVFTQYSGHDIHYWTSRSKNIEKFIIYKYLYGLSVTGGDIVEYLGRLVVRTPAINRQRFTESFKTNPANYAAWQKFREYIAANKIVIK